MRRAGSLPRSTPSTLTDDGFRARGTLSRSAKLAMSRGRMFHTPPPDESTTTIIFVASFGSATRRRGKDFTESMVTGTRWK